MSAAVDRRVVGRVEVNEVDEQLATFDTDKTVPVPGDFVAVSGTHCQVSAVNVLTTLMRAHTHTHTHTYLCATQSYINTVFVLFTCALAAIFVYISGNSLKFRRLNSRDKIRMCSIGLAA